MKLQISKWQKITSGILVLIALFFLVTPTYIREALIYWYPDISDTYIFSSNTVHKSDSCRNWPTAKAYNKYVMNDKENAYLKQFGTVAFLVIQHDSIVYEEYRDGWTPDKLSNIFSATKSIVGLLAGIAFDEGYIESLDDKIGKYLPEFNQGKKAEISVRNLLTMSSGLNWDESYSSLFSTTTEAYYGDQIRKLVIKLKATEKPGVQFSYKSGDTQILAFVIEAALKQKNSPFHTISQYAEEKLWKPLQACNSALWNLDKKKGDEKAYCCFNTTARDLARLGHLIMHNGNWNGRQLISETYMREATLPAAYLRNEFNDGQLDYYGFQIWIMHYRGMQFPYLRGLGGQYIYIIPEKDAIIIRLGHKKNSAVDRERTIDIADYLDIAFEIIESADK